MKIICHTACFLAVLLCSLVNSPLFAQQKDTIRFVLSVPHPETHAFHVAMTCPTEAGKRILFKLPQWTPGYYQLMNYARHITQFTATDSQGNALAWSKTGDNTWLLSADKPGRLTLEYDVAADRAFVATSFTDSAHAYITPASAFLYPEGRLQTPVLLAVQPSAGWSRVACGLDSVAGKAHTYCAPDYDMLYDCPVLMGNLEELPPFSINGIPHRFAGYKLGDFDRSAFMFDLKRVVQAGHHRGDGQIKSSGRYRAYLYPAAERKKVECCGCLCKERGPFVFHISPA